MTPKSQRPSATGPRGVPPRIVTAASLFDGHDAAIHIVRRILQALGAEVVHLGHDRSVDEIVDAAIQEDAHAVAVSSYQGGHMEFFGYLVARLRERGAGHVRVYGGGGATILPHERAQLMAAGVSRIFGPEEGRALGLEGMVASVLAELHPEAEILLRDEVARASVRDHGAIARTLSWLERAAERPPETTDAVRRELDARASGRAATVLGVTGPGGAGKSSVVDELVLRLRRDFPELTIGLLLVDPSRSRRGGALLGDRIRMNAIHAPTVYTRSIATRRANLALSASVSDARRLLVAAGFDLVILETAGIGQSDSEVVEQADVSVYVMTPEYGAPSQLEKIDMLELADFVVLNKSDRRGGPDALRDVRKQWQRNHAAFASKPDEIPVFPTVASRWNDAGIERFYRALLDRLRREAVAPRLPASSSSPDIAALRERAGEDDVRAIAPLIPEERQRYLADVVDTVQRRNAQVEQDAEHASVAGALAHALRALGQAVPPEGVRFSDWDAKPPPSSDASVQQLRERYDEAIGKLSPESRAALTTYPSLAARYRADTQEHTVRERTVAIDNFTTTLSGLRVPRVALPRADDWGERVRFLAQVGLPGAFPFASGVFAFKQADEDPTRMFAGEGSPERTNRRFHLLARGQRAARLSTAFDSVTLYGRDPAERPDIYGKVGNSGVSVATLDAAKKLYSGFDLADARTSVSMTINGPAPIVLAFYMNAAIDQAVENHLRQTGKLEEVRARAARQGALPSYEGELPAGHSGLGLGLLGISGADVVDQETYARIASDVLGRVRGTVQADILKEEQAQNTCIFSVDFALRAMGDVQEHFIRNRVRSFYSVSVSGYHIAEAGANPITQLAFTLANAFTYVEHYLARGMRVDEFAPNFSFFFSHGLDAEYNVIGRVARRIWAIAMRDLYGASERAQKLKYHVQTSGRSLHAQEMAWNDVRTTLQAFSALADHCNSLHTNAYDEAITTPTEASVRAALAIQLILQRELGLLKNENVFAGSFVIEELAESVERAVLAELSRISERGGVLGAMETLYQRAKIQDESLEYEAKKHSGELPIVGVNTFVREAADLEAKGQENIVAVRADESDKRAQLRDLRAFHARQTPHVNHALTRLQDVVRRGENVFDELMVTVRHASLGQISDALFAVGGRYRRSL